MKTFNNIKELEDFIRSSINSEYPNPKYIASVIWNWHDSKVKNLNIHAVIKSGCQHHKSSSRAMINGVEHWQCLKCKEWQK